MPFKPGQSSLRSWKWVVLALTGCLILAGMIWWNVSRNEQAGGPLPPIYAISAPRTVDTETEAAIAAFCGDCHAAPSPESFTKDRWYDEVRLGYQAYARSGRNDLTPPPIQDTVAYYQSKAPEQLQFPVAQPVDNQLRAGFVVEQLDWNQDNYVLPAISFLRWGSFGLGQGPQLLVCDMRDGSVSLLDLQGTTRRRTVLAQFVHPCHAEPCDLDADGLTDLVVAELGSFYPTDHGRGKVVWLRRNAEAESFSPVTLA